MKYIKRKRLFLLFLSLGILIWYILVNCFLIRTNDCREYCYINNLEEMVNQADYIFVGTIQGTNEIVNLSRIENKIDEGYVYQLDIKEMLKGNAFLKQISIVQEHAYTQGGQYIVCKNYVPLRTNSEYIVFCDKINSYPYYLQPFYPCYIMNNNGYADYLISYYPASSEISIYNYSFEDVKKQILLHIVK